MMKTAMEQIKEMVDVNTIVGDAVFSQDGTIILPVSKVCFGFVAGGGEYARKTGSATARMRNPAPAIPLLEAPAQGSP